MSYLPRRIDKVQVPPIKCQGIKTKLVDFISSNIDWDGNGTWLEPFLGSGVVLFNIAPAKAIVGDLNEHIINLYRKIQSKEITSFIVREYLEDHGAILKKKGGDYYYEMRDRFNKEGDPLQMLFLNRSCFNGMMRFNRSGGFNVPFCKKPQRFRKAYITKIVNQVEAISKIIEGKDWQFLHTDWREIIQLSTEDDFIYLDPPYIGRHTGYVDQWEESDAEELAEMTKKSKAGFALSMWLSNKYRTNEHIEECWKGLPVRSFEHFYHVGSKESLRNKIDEGLVVHPDYITSDELDLDIQKEQLELNV